MVIFHSYVSLPEGMFTVTCSRAGATEYSRDLQGIQGAPYPVFPWLPGPKGHFIWGMSQKGSSQMAGENW